jgi:hypothetical protein
VQICTVCAFISVIELPRIPAYYPKEKTSAQRQKRKNRCWADPFSRLIYIHWWRF